MVTTTAETEGSPAKTAPMRPATLADRYLADVATHQGALTVRYYRGSFWWWTPEEPCYVPVGHTDMTYLVLKWLIGKGVTGSYKTAEEVRHCLAAKTAMQPGVELPCWLTETDRPLDYIAFANGLVAPSQVIASLHRPRPVEPLEHTPEWFGSVGVPYAYDPEAKCPIVDEWLQRRLHGDQERISLVWEWFGYCLTPDISRQSVLVLVGGGGTGKSTLCRLLERLVGLDNVTHVRLDSLGRRFSFSCLAGKRVNICDEMVDLSSRDEAALKALTGGERVAYEAKYRDVYEDWVTARFVLAFNEWPTIRDTSNAVYRRLRVIVMDDKIPTAEFDPSTEVRLHNERAGVFNAAMRGLWRLREQRHFTEPRVSAREIALVQDEGQPCRVFVEKMLREDPRGFVSHRKRTALYRRWCEDQGFAPEKTERALRREIMRSFPRAKEAQGPREEGRPWGIRGISWKQL